MAYLFDDASSEYLSANNPLSVLPISYSGWFKSDDPSSSTGQNICSMHDVATGDGFVRMAYQLNVAGDPLRANIFDDSGNAGDDNLGESSAWNHGTATFNSSGHASGSVNGGTFVTDSGNTVPMPTVDEFAIGATDLGSGATQFFSGSLAEIAVWDVELTQAEAVILSKGYSPLFVRPQSLVFYAPLIREIQDIIGGLSITTNGTPAVSNHPRIIYPSAPFILAFAGVGAKNPFYPRNPMVGVVS